jgi:hypothetical protein
MKRRRSPIRMAMAELEALRGRGLTTDFTDYTD